MNVSRSTSSIVAAGVLCCIAPLVACSSPPGEGTRSGAQAQADDVQPCDPKRPETWHYVDRPVEANESIMAIVVDGTPVTFDLTCDPSEPAYCGWQKRMIAAGGGSPDGVLGWLVSNTCAVHAQYSYRIMFLDRPAPNERTWGINSRFANEAPVFALSIQPFGRVPIFTSEGCYATDGDGVCVSPRLALSRELTSRARGGVAAGDPSNPPLQK
jgi:hypothetical protein